MKRKQARGKQKISENQFRNRATQSGRASIDDFVADSGRVLTMKKTYHSHSDRLHNNNLNEALMKIISTLYPTQ